MTPRAPLLLAPALFGLLSACSGGPDGPHVLLVTVDTLRSDRVGAYGYGLDTTPNLDRLAEEGVLFERSYSHAPFTAPSHASLLTGLHPQSHGVLFWGQPLAPDAPTFQQLFAARGYRTAALHNHPGLVGNHITRDFDEVQVRYFEPWQATVGAFFEWVDGERNGRPLAAWVHLWDAHRPYGFRDWRAEFVRPHVKREGADLTLAYAEEGFGPVGDRRVGRTEAFYNVRADQRSQPFDVGGRMRPLTEDDWKYIADRYDASIAYADQGLGALVEGLSQRRLLENTILVVTSDHGETLMERDPVWFTHDPYLYDEVLRVPLVLRLPGGEAGGTRVSTLARGVDVLPTLLELTDIALPSKVSIQGRSLVRLWRDGAVEERILFAGTQTRSAKESDRKVGPQDPWIEYRQTVTDGNFKVIHDLELNRWSAFDLKADPGETRDLLAGGQAPSESILKLKEHLVLSRSTLPVSTSLAEPMGEQQQAILSQMGYL